MVINCFLWCNETVLYSRSVSAKQRYTSLFDVMVLHSRLVNVCKTASATALYICGRSKFVTGFKQVNDYILLPFRVILSASFFISLKKIDWLNHRTISLYRIKVLYDMPNVIWVINPYHPTKWSFPTVISFP